MKASHLIAWTTLLLLAATALFVDLGWIGVQWTELDPSKAYLSPNRQFWLGTDQMGRDVLARLLSGLSLSLKLGVLSAALTVTFGSVMGICAALLGSRVDLFIRLVALSIDSIPYILLASILAFILGQGLVPLILALACTGWTPTYRIVRAETLKIVQKSFSQSAVVMGQSFWSYTLQTLLPSLRSIILTKMGLFFIFAIKFEVALSFIGIGLPPGAPSLGNIISNARIEFLQGIWWTFVPSAILLFLVSLCLNGVLLVRDHASEA